LYYHCYICITIAGTSLSQAVPTDTLWFLSHRRAAIRLQIVNSRVLPLEVFLRQLNNDTRKDFFSCNIIYTSPCRCETTLDVNNVFWRQRTACKVDSNRRVYNVSVTAIMIIADERLNGQYESSYAFQSTDNRAGRKEAVLKVFNIKVRKWICYCHSERVHFRIKQSTILCTLYKIKYESQETTHVLRFSRSDKVIIIIIANYVIIKDCLSLLPPPLAKAALFLVQSSMTSLNYTTSRLR